MTARSSQRTALMDRYRGINVDYQWWDGVYENFTERMKGIGINVTEMYFSGFCSQGDGACFEAGLMGDGLTYLDHHHAGEYPMIRKLIEMGGSISVGCRQRGHCYHEYSASFSSDCDKFYQVMTSRSELQDAVIEQWDNLLDAEMCKFDTAVTDKWREYMKELYRELEAEYDHLTSDETVWDSIVANDLDEDDEDEREAA